MFNFQKLKDITNVYAKNPDTAAAYKAGYEDKEKEFEKLKMERDTAVAQIHKLGYEIGEPYSPIREAVVLKKTCTQRLECSGCDFNSSRGCILNGRPRDWSIMG